MSNSNNLFSTVHEDIEVKKNKKIKKNKSKKKITLNKKKEIALNQFIKSLNEKYEEKKIDLTNPKHKEEYDREIQKYKWHLEDLHLYNQKMENKRRELSFKYDTSDKGLTELRDKIVEQLIEEKKDFFGLTEKPEVEIEVENPRIPIVITEPSDSKNTVSVDLENPDVLLEKFTKSAIEFYNKIDNLMLERNRIIALELKNYEPFIKREVQVTRKLKIETRELIKKYSEMKKYQNNNDLMMDHIEKILKKRQIELEKHFITNGIDPREHDIKSLENARAVWRAVQKNRPLMANNTDSEKLNHYREKYQEFYNSFQIVLKYMVLQNQFDEDAFLLFLKKCRDSQIDTKQTAFNQMPNQVRREVTDDQKSGKLNEKELLWLENQSYYVEYLAKNIQYKKSGRHVPYNELIFIRNQAFNLLKKEMSDFRKEFYKKDENIKKEDTAIQEELIKDMTNSEMYSGMSVEELENLAKELENVDTSE
jgi:hypothetical protein